MRLSAPAMAEALMDGAVDGGADVLDLGMVGTEMVYFAVGELGLDGGVCVTASHDPKEYTGMKIVRSGALPVGGDSGLEDVRRGAEAGFGDVSRRGKIRAEDIWDGFVAKVLSFVDRGLCPSAEGCRRRRERHGGGDAPAGARAAAPARSRPVLLEPDGRSPTTSPTPSSPRTAPSSSRRPGRRAPTPASPTTATPIAAPSSTTREGSCPATSSRRSWRARCLRPSPARG